VGRGEVGDGSRVVGGRHGGQGWVWVGGEGKC